jgi:cytochrome bd ubiquinol oxidase subunit I
VPGLNDFVAPDGTVLHPPVAPVFWSFRVMVGAGLAMLALSWTGVLLLRRHGASALPRPYLMGLAAATFIGWIATLAGWYTTEIGRQPWLVQGVLTTRDALGDVAGGMVLSTFVGYMLIYAALVLAYIGTLTSLAQKAAKGQGLPPHRPLPSALPAE